MFCLLVPIIHSDFTPTLLHDQEKECKVNNFVPIIAQVTCIHCEGNYCCGYTLLQLYYERKFNYEYKYKSLGCRREKSDITDTNALVKKRRASCEINIMSLNINIELDVS